MSKSKSQASTLFDSAVLFAKKMAQSGVDTLNQMAPAVTPLDQQLDPQSSIEGQARNTYNFDKKYYTQPQHMLREHLPQVSSQILGKHYSRMSRLGQMLSPELNQKVADYFFDYLNVWVSKQNAVADLLEEVGVKQLSELQQDIGRSQRISQALSNQNKVIATLLGMLTGATGVVGAAVDVPSSLILALKSIYQTGRAYGFELAPEDYNVVEYIFKHVDMGSVAEKQALLAALRAFSQMLVSHDLSQLQQLMGSSNDLAPLKAWLSTRQHVPTWLQLEHNTDWGAFAVLAKFTPVASMGVSAIYSCHLVRDASEKAQQIFSEARQYLLNHPEQDLDPLSAYLAQQHKQSKSVDSLTWSEDTQKKVEVLTDHSSIVVAESVETSISQPEDESTSLGSDTQVVAVNPETENTAIGQLAEQVHTEIVEQSTESLVQPKSVQGIENTRTAAKAPRKRRVKKSIDMPES